MANIFTQNPMRLDTVMGSSYLATIGASAGLERPVKIVKVQFDPGTTAAGTFTITDGSAGANVLLDETNTVIGGSSQDFNMSDGTILWRNFQLTAITGTGAVVWIWRK